ncbi:MAG: hypothetical protein M3Q97_02125 [Bacteroidota bacterium]|nr:hypothetical protein [Bacteroidota bacterium]
MIKKAVILMILSFAGCSLDDLSPIHVTGRYYVVERDYVDKNSKLSFELESGTYIGIVKPTVFAAGFNDSFIFAKRHPMELFESHPRMDITEWYIVKRNRDSNGNDLEPVDTFGPYSEQHFYTKLSKLGVQRDSVAFTIVKESVK